VICDEVCVALSLNLFTLKEFFAVLACKPAGVEVILTGRNAPEKLIEKADLVTEMKAVKHYFDAGVEARVGIEK
jgi:cob(I)alamin adenosyltransferase